MLDLPKSQIFVVCRMVVDKSTHICRRVAEEKADLMRKFLGFSKFPDQFHDAPV